MKTVIFMIGFCFCSERYLDMYIFFGEKAPAETKFNITDILHSGPKRRY